MTVLSTNNRNNYVGTGTTGPFSFTYRIVAASDLTLTTRDLNGIETTLDPSVYVVTGVGNRAGGSVTLTTALAVGWTLTIRRVRPLLQQTDFRNQGQYFAETHEDAFDNAMVIDQQLAEEIDASVHLPETINPAAFDTTLPSNLVPGNAIVVNGPGTGFGMAALSAATLSAWSAAQNQKLDSFTSAHGDFVAGTTTVLTLSANPGSAPNVWVAMRVSGLNRVFETDEFSVSGTTLTFTAPIPTGTTRVEVRYFLTFQINTADALNVTYAPASGPGTDVRTRLRAIDAAIVNLPNDIEGLHIKDFGVVGDGTTNDTTAMQAALTAGAAQNKVVYGGNCVVKVTAALTMAGPGLVFDATPHGDSGGPGLKVTGTGYTALTVTGIVTQFRVTVWGTGNTANGIVFQNPILSVIMQARVFGLDGFGVQINKCYDCLFGAISVEQCGNASNYAFSVNDGGDSSNMSHFLRIQVEKATAKAIFISANTLSCVFHNIHSEQATPSAGVDTWFLGSNRSTYMGGRFEANAPSANATLHLNAANGSYSGFLVEGSIDVAAEANNSMTIIEPEIQGTFHAVTNQTGKIMVYGGSIASMPTDAAAFRVFGTNIGTLTIGFAFNPVIPTLARFIECDIATLASSSALSAASFDGCVIAEGNSLLRGATILNNCDVTCSGSLAHSSGQLLLSNTTIHAALSYTNHAAIRLRNGSKIVGAVTRGDAGTTDILCDASSTIGPGSSNVGVPTGGAHIVGDRHQNPIPTVGQPKAWICTVAATPGTFVSEGNL